MIFNCLTFIYQVFNLALRLFLMNDLAYNKEVQTHSRNLNGGTMGIKVSKKTLDDYWKFFTTEEGADILPYAYMGPSHYYNDLIKNCEDYYLCRDEIEILSNNKKVFEQYLADVECIMEIGPGSVHAVENKSLNILKSAKDLKLYQGVDYSKSYLKEACNFVKEQLPAIKVEQIRADLQHISNIKIKEHDHYKKAIVFLGSTLGNFKHHQQEHIINEFSKLANDGDLLILTVDTNQDKESVLKAYDNKFFLDFAKVILQYYAKINPEFKDLQSLFEAVAYLDNTNTINTYFTVNEKVSFSFDSHRVVNLKAGQKLKGIISQKPNLNFIKNLLTEYSFDIIKTLTTNLDQMKVLICKKKR